MPRDIKKEKMSTIDFLKQQPIQMFHPGYFVDPSPIMIAKLPKESLAQLQNKQLDMVINQTQLYLDYLKFQKEIFKKTPL